MDNGRGLAVKLRSGEVQVRSGSVYSPKFNHFELDSEVGRLVKSLQLFWMFSSVLQTTTASRDTLVPILSVESLKLTNQVVRFQMLKYI